MMRLTWTSAALIGLAYLAPSSAETGYNVAFVKYHKTGHRLSAVLQRAVHHVLSDVHTDFRDAWPKRQCFPGGQAQKLKCTRQISALTAPELVCTTNGDLPTCFKIVHMVREPQIWAVSFYDYHRQKPPPEHWEDQVRPSCRLPQALQSLYVQALEPFGLTTALLDAAIRTCDALVHGNKTYLEHMRMLPEADGVRFMAYMNILDAQTTLAGADVLRSAVNAVLLRNHHVFDLYMDDVLEDLSGSMARLASFLANDSFVANSSTRATTDANSATQAKVDKGIAERLKASFILYQKQNFASAAQGNHITSFNISSDHKAVLMSHLEQDPVLAAIAASWRRVFSTD